MSKKYVLQLSSKYKVEVDTARFQVRSGLAGVLDIANLLTPALWYLFLYLLFPAAHFLGMADAGGAHLLWLYGFVVSLLFLQIIKRLISKSDYLPTVPYDLLLLTFTSLVAISLFISVLSTEQTFSIWGGKNLRVISGLSIIVLWFLYYLTNIFARNSVLFSRTVHFFAWSPVVAVVVNLLANVPYYQGIAMPMMVMAPAWLWLVLSKTSGKFVYALNLLLSLVMLAELKDGLSVFIFTASILVAGVLVFVANYKGIGKLFSNLNKGVNKLISRKATLSGFLNDNDYALYILLTALTVVAGALWMLSNSDQQIFTGLTNGIELLDLGSGVRTILFGNGLTLLGGSFVLQFLHSYGVLSSIVIVIFLVWVFKDLITQFFRQKGSEQRGVILFVLTFLTTSLITFIVSVGSDLHFILFWLFLGFAGVLKSVYVQKTKLALKNDVNKFNKLKNSTMGIGLQYARIAIILLLVLCVFYFWSLLQLIQGFIS
ncbi:MAG: hypothetical protein ACE5DX_04690 [Candidatus Dojkabacteria bacterium]